MSAAVLNEGLDEEERRGPPVTLSEVLAACRELEMAGLPVTRRSVREKLGRGSMTTVHNGVTQYESRRELPAPAIDLTQEDRNVIADLGARALAIAEGRVERVLAEREAVLQTQIAAANARADDAISAAEVLVSEAQRHTMEALATSEAARLERDRAVSEAEEAKHQALRLEGQLARLLDEKEKMAIAVTAAQEDLMATTAQLAAETALRQRLEADLATSAEADKVLRSEHAEKDRENTEVLSRVREALAAEQSRLGELLGQRIQSGEAIERLEKELSIRDAEVAHLRAGLARAEAALWARDQTVKELTNRLSNEKANAQQLTLILAAMGEHTEALRSLEACISSHETNE